MDATINLTLREALALFSEHYLPSKRPSHADYLMGRLGDVRGQRPLRPNSLLAFLGDVSLEAITVGDLQAWANALTQQKSRYASANSSRPKEEGGLSVNTIDGYRRCLSAFWKWLVRWPDIPINHDLTTAVSWPAAPKLWETPPRAISDDTAVALLQAPASLRDHALIRFLLFTGVRTEEAAELLRSDVDLVKRHAFIRDGKGGKSRYVFFDAFTAAILAEYIEDTPRLSSLFNMSCSAIAQTIKRLTARTAVSEPVSPHRLRHWFATTALAHGGNESFVQDQMGHSDFNMTRRYSRFTPEKLRPQYDAVFGGDAARALAGGLFAAPVLLNGRKKSDADYGRLAKRAGLEWLGPLPATVSDKTRWRCRDGHEWETAYRSIQQGSGCPVCAGLARKTANDFHALGREHKVFWLGPDVGNNSTATGWACSFCGFQWEASFDAMAGCPTCRGSQPYSPDCYHELARERGIFWGGDSPVPNIRTKTLWRDGDGHEWLASFTAVRESLTMGQRTAVDYAALGVEKSATWLGPEVSNNRSKTWWRCRCGRRFEATYNRMQQGLGLCVSCTKKHLRQVQGYGEAQYVALARENGVSWIGETLPRNAKTKTRWRCSCGREWVTSYDSLQKNSGKCRKCARQVNLARQMVGVAAD